QDMLSPYTPGADTSKSVTSITFCSPGFPSGQQITSGGTATVYAGTNGACAISATYSIDGNTNTQTTVPQTLSKSIKPYTFSFPINQPLTMNTGDRIDVTFTFPGCNNPAIYYGGSTFPGQFQTPLSPIPVPATP